MKIVFVSSRDSGSGAARAVYRIFESIQHLDSITSEVWLRVVHKTSNNPGVIGGKPERNTFEFAKYFLKTRFRKYFPRKPFVTTNEILHSEAKYDTGLGRELNTLNADVIMLGWLGGSTLSIREISRLNAPVVWRLSDMWMFSGAEHYTTSKRYSHGYSRSSRPSYESGPDINRETFKRKERLWKAPRHVICPSNWMADQVKKSTLTADWPVHVIPNPIDTDFWRPIPRADARKRLGLPGDAIIVLFGAEGGISQPHKGGDLLLNALPRVRELLKAQSREKPIVCAVFGDESKPPDLDGLTIQFLGRLDDEALREAYSAADVMVVPSRIDNFPSTAVEAQACGTPVAAFSTAGLPDIVDEGVTGALAQPFSHEDLARCITWIVEDDDRRKKLGKASTARAHRLWNPETVARQYLAVLEEAAGN